MIVVSGKRQQPQARKERRQPAKIDRYGDHHCLDKQQPANRDRGEQ